MNIVHKRVWTSLVVLVTMIAGCLAPADEPVSLILEFPAAADLGELWLMEDVNCFTCGNGQENVGRATGTRQVRLPSARWYVRLKMPKSASSLLPFLAHPSLSHIGDLDLQGSDVKDEDLQYLAGIDLRSINLSKTAITGAGLKYLKPHQRWMFITLEDCTALDPQYLAHFRGWKRATVRLVPYKGTGDTYSAAEEQLLARAKHIICDDEPEQICGTQIR